MSARKHRNVSSAVRPKRRQPSATADVGAAARLQAILRSPSYLQADEDAAFLERDEARGARLQLDYLKPEVLLAANGIERTIVVFGSTRINEPRSAAARVATLRKALAAHPNNRELKRQLAVAERMSAKARYYDIAREFGRLVGDTSCKPNSPRLVIMTGGGPGIMEAANRGAFDCGAPSVGLNIHLPRGQVPNSYISPELCFQLHYFALRKLHFLLRAKALVAFPGGYGTLDELFEALSLIQTGMIKPLPVVLVGERFWQRVFDVDFLVDEGVIDSADRGLFWYAETAHEAWDGILNWHSMRGEPLFLNNEKRRRKQK